MTYATSAQPTQRVTNHRRRYYIKRAFQRRFILQFCILAIGGCVLFGALLYAYATQTLTTAFFHSKVRVMSTAEFLLPALGVSTLLVASVVALATVVRLLFFSHQIAGPLYRLEKTAKAIGDGDLSLQVRLRRRDELQEFARSLDGMVADLRTRVQQLKDQTERLRAIINEANQRPEMPQELIRQLQDTQGRLDEVIGRFHL